MKLVEYYLKDIAKEQEGFLKVLQTYLPSPPYNPSRILNICAGVAHEEPLLERHFEAYSELISLDINPHWQEFWKALNIKSGQIGDVRKLGKYVEGKFDLVIGRNVPLNPNYKYLEKNIPDCWPKVFEDLTKFIDVHSTLFLTLVREDEFYRAQEILEDHRYIISTAERNPIVVPNDYIGVSTGATKDHYIIIAKPPIKEFEDSLFPKL